LLSKDHESAHAIEVVDSIIDDKQMGSDHCPIALKLKITNDGEAETGADEYAGGELRTLADIPNDLNGDHEEEKGANESADQEAITMGDLPSIEKL